MHRAIGIVGMAERRAEQRHESVAHIFIHDAAVSFDDRTHPGEIAIQNSQHLVRRKQFAHVGEIAQVRKENGHLAFFSTEHHIFTQ